MTASAILHVCVTMGVVQALCDLLAHWRVFSQEPYQHALEKRSRALFRQEKAQKEANQATDHQQPQQQQQQQQQSAAKATAANHAKKSGKLVRTAKALERAQQDVKDANALVARYYIGPNILTSIVFLILMRVMGTEHQGEIMGLLPFVPFQFVQRITQRGLEFSTPQTLEMAEDQADKAAAAGTSVGQAFSFVFLYFLAGLSVKFYVSRLFGHRPPGGTDSLFSIAESTWGQNLLKAAGVDPDILKEMKEE